MSPFKLKSVGKKLDKINLNREDSTYSIKPFVQKWIKDHPLELSYPLKSENLPFDEWKTQVHNHIKEKIKVLDPLPLNEQEVEYHGEAEANGIKFIKLSLMTLPGLRVPAILCVPENLDKKVPAVICIRGHMQKKENSVGLKKSKSKEYFGYELAKKGMITLSLDWIGSAERERFKEKFLFFFRNESERSNWFRFLGLDMLGLRITEIKGFLNYLETRDDVDPNQFGIVGHSGGGTQSLFTTVFDDRIKVTGTSGYFGTWEHSILSMFHCGCNYSPGLGEKIEMFDVYASLAPRPVVATIGMKDKIFPYKGTQKAIPIIKAAYEEAGQPENFLIDVEPKGHMFYKNRVYPFLLDHLDF